MYDSVRLSAVKVAFGQRTLLSQVFVGSTTVFTGINLA